MPEEPQDIVPQSDVTPQNTYQQPSNISQNIQQSDDISQNLNQNLNITSQNLNQESNVTPQITEQQSYFVPQVGVDSSTPIAPLAAPIIGSQINTPLPQKKNNKKMVIIIVIALILSLGIGVAAFAAYSWYQTPQKVITDSLVNVITADTSIYSGTVSVSNDEVKAVVDITAKQVDVTGSLAAKLTLTFKGDKYIVDGNALIDKIGDIYFKVENISDILDMYKSNSGDYLKDPAVSTAIDKFVKKVDGTWIKISNSDIEKYIADYSTTKTCISDAVGKFKDNKKQIAEVSDTYSKNQFIVIDKSLGQKDGSFGYRVKTDNKLLKTFVEDFKRTEVYVALHKCDSDYEINTDEITNNSSTSQTEVITEVWIDALSHRATKISVDSDYYGTKYSVIMNPKYNQKVEIVAPSSSISLTELATYYEEYNTATSDYYDSYYASIQ